MTKIDTGFARMDVVDDPEAVKDAIYDAFTYVQEVQSTMATRRDLAVKNRNEAFNEEARLKHKLREVFTKHGADSTETAAVRQALRVARVWVYSSGLAYQGALAPWQAWTRAKYNLTGFYRVMDELSYEEHTQPHTREQRLFCAWLVGVHSNLPTHVSLVQRPDTDDIADDYGVPLYAQRRPDTATNTDTDAMRLAARALDKLS